MAKNPNKKKAAEASALDIHRRLKRMRPASIPSERQWTIQADASPSFFTNLAGGKKAPSDPTVNNLRAILRAAGSSLPEFFLHEAEGRLVAAPSKQALEAALLEALSDLPRAPERRAEYLASTVFELLGLPANRLASSQDPDGQGRDALSKASPARAATKSA